MTVRISVRYLVLVLVAACTAVSATGCSFGGLNSLPLPGAAGREPDAQIFHIEIANVGALESNSPVLIDDVVVGSVGKMTVQQWHANVEISVQPGAAVPANAVAAVGQTSLLGSMHLALNPPVGQQPEGRLQPGATLGLDTASTFPSTEQTLSSLSALVNGGGLGQIGDVLHNVNTALSGRTDEVRELLTRLNDTVGVLATQRDDVVESLKNVNRLADTFAGQRDVLDRALKAIPPALDVLVQQRPQLTEALAKLGDFTQTLNGVVSDVHADLVTNLKNLEPTIRVLADVGPDLDAVLAYLTTYPLSQDIIDRGVRGDYMNLFAVIDLTVPRLKRTMLLGTRFAAPQNPLTAAPGDPWYTNYSLDPLVAPILPAGAPPVAAPPAGQPATPPPAGMPVTDAAGPPMAVSPPVPLTPPSLGGPAAPVFAGPYGSAGPPSPPVTGNP